MSSVNCWFIQSKLQNHGVTDHFIACHWCHLDARWTGSLRSLSDMYCRMFSESMTNESVVKKWCSDVHVIVSWWCMPCKSVHWLVSSWYTWSSLDDRCKLVSSSCGAHPLTVITAHALGSIRSMCLWQCFFFGRASIVCSVCWETDFVPCMSQLFLTFVWVFVACHVVHVGWSFDFTFAQCLSSVDWIRKDVHSHKQWLINEFA